MQFSSDLKLLGICLGCHTSSTHNCPYGFCYRMLNGKKHGKLGRYHKSEIDKTPNNCLMWNLRWLDTGPGGGGGDKAKLSDFMNCQFPPLDLFDPADRDKKVLLLNPPCLLHLYLGDMIFHISSDSSPCPVLF